MAEKHQYKLTEKRIRILQSAASHELGLVSNPIIQGFERVTWNRNADYLAKHGLIEAYVHGGFEITNAGRAALAAATGEAS